MAISLNLKSDKPEDLVRKRAMVIKFMTKHTDFYIAKANKGAGANRAVILGRVKNQRRWEQMTKVWAHERADAISYVAKLIWEVNNDKPNQK